MTERLPHTPQVQSLESITDEEFADVVADSHLDDDFLDSLETGGVSEATRGDAVDEDDLFKDARAAEEERNILLSIFDDERITKFHYMYMYGITPDAMRIENQPDAEEY